MPSPPAFDDAFRARLRVLLTWRRDVRRFRRDPLPAGALERLIELAALAPSVGLSQPWRFVAGRRSDPARRGSPQFRRCQCRRTRRPGARTRRCSYARLKLAGLDEAPCHLAVFADRATPHRARPRPAHDARDGRLFGGRRGAHACGSRRAPRGSAWAGCRSSTRMRWARSSKFPPTWKLIGYFCLGYPAEEDEAPMLETAGWEARRPPALVPDPAMTDSAMSSSGPSASASAAGCSRRGAARSTRRA